MTYQCYQLLSAFQLMATHNSGPKNVLLGWLLGQPPQDEREVSFLHFSVHRTRQWPSEEDQITFLNFQLVLVPAGIRRLVVQIKAIEKVGLILLCGLVDCHLPKEPNRGYDLIPQPTCSCRIRPERPQRAPLTLRTLWSTSNRS